MDPWPLSALASWNQIMGFDPLDNRARTDKQIHTEDQNGGWGLGGRYLMVLGVIRLLTISCSWDILLVSYENLRKKVESQVFQSYFCGRLSIMGAATSSTPPTLSLLPRKAS